MEAGLLPLLSNSGTTVSGLSSQGNHLIQPNNYINGSFTFSGASDSAFNTVCTNFQWTTAAAFTCTIAGLTGSHTAASATATFTNGNAVNFYPAAEVVDIQNESTTPPSRDGTLVTEPSIIPWHTNDVLEEVHPVGAQFNLATNGLFVWNPYNQDAQLFNITCTGTGCLGGGAGPTLNSLMLVSNNSALAQYVGWGGQEAPINGITMRGPTTISNYYEFGPSAALNMVHLDQFQSLNPNYNYDIFSLYASATSAFPTCHENYNPVTDTISWNGCNTVFNGAYGSLILPVIDLKTSAGLYSAIGYNFAPYSNNLLGSTWQVTSSGSTATITCSITDDFGDPGCTITNTGGTGSYNLGDWRSKSYTALSANTQYTVQMRVKGVSGNEHVTQSARRVWGQDWFLPATPAWQDICSTITTGLSGSFQNFAQINVDHLQAVEVANVVTRPGPACGPPILTTNNQFTTPTAVNTAGNMAINNLSLPLISGSTQCLQTSSTGVVSGTGSPCGSGGTTSTICSGTLTLSGTINTLTAGSAGTATCTGLASTDAIIGSFNGTPFGITGFAPSATGILTCALVPSTNTITAYCSNNTSSNITIGASAVINYRVVR